MEKDQQNATQTGAQKAAVAQTSLQTTLFASKFLLIAAVAVGVVGIVAIAVDSGSWSVVED